MSIKNIFCLGILLFYACQQAEAAEDYSSECLIHSSQDILNCVFANHPDVVNAKLAQTRDKNLVKAARQLPNPELEGKIILPKNAVQLETETSLLATLELGGKRKGRISDAISKSLLATGQLLQTQERGALETVLALNRLRQIRTEAGLIEESLGAFDQLIQQLKKRLKRSPEQEVSLSVFELAYGESFFRKSELRAEEESLIQWLEWATGTKGNRITKFLPPSKKVWPQIDTTTLVSKNSEIKTASAELKQAEAGKKSAQAMAWPDLKMGPAIDTENVAGDTRLRFGGRMTLALPVLSLNRGKKLVSAMEVKRARTHLINTQRKSEFDRLKEVVRYEQAVNALKRAPGLGALKEAHQMIDENMAKGFVPATLALEAHRQILESAISRHEQELIALSAMWRIAILDGKIFEEKL